MSLLKAIPEPQLQLTNFDITVSGSEVIKTETPSFNAGIIPIAGQIFFGDINNPISTNETLMYYSITIYEEDDPTNILDKSGVIFTGDNIEKNSIY